MHPKKKERPSIKLPPPQFIFNNKLLEKSFKVPEIILQRDLIIWLLERWVRERELSRFRTKFQCRGNFVFALSQLLFFSSKPARVYPIIGTAREIWLLKKRKGISSR